jgi:hypothetical protein
MEGNLNRKIAEQAIHHQVNIAKTTAYLFTSDISCVGTITAE